MLDGDKCADAQVTGAGCCERTKPPAHTAGARASLAGEEGRKKRIARIERRREGRSVMHWE